MRQALLFALKGDFHEAEARVPGIIARIQINDNQRHHSTYNAACIYALAGQSGEAVKMLRENAQARFPNDPPLTPDSVFDRVRHSAGFAPFMAEEKAPWGKDPPGVLV